jgi:two-component system CheB/CheR fusion protein
MYYVCTGIDISERKKAEAEIRRLNEDLERRVVERTAQLQRANEVLEGEIIERRRAEDALRESEARFRRLFESNMIGVFFSDLDGTIIDANDAFLTMLGYGRDDLLADQLSWEKLTPDEYAVDDRKAISTLRGQRVCRPYEKEFFRKQGDRIPILVGMALLEGSQHITVAFVVDLTERKRAELELKQAMEVAEAANRAKDQFLAVLSHELRTPLNPVLSAAAALADEPGLSETVRPFVEIIRRNVELEARLIDDLLDLTRITNGKLQLNLELVDVHTLIQNALEICHADIQSKQLHVYQKLGAKRHMVCGDSARLHQVFWNLIKNAVKFTSQGRDITIRTEAAGKRIRVSVVDTGIGIEADVLPRIFNAFEQGEQTITRRFGGLGLGLAISKMLVDLHGGSLFAESKGKDKGATFSIELDLATPGDAAINVATPSAVESHEHGTARILLVDDHADTSRVMKIMLEQKGYHVVTADSVQTALDRAADGDFDLLISDIGLPDGSGLDLIQALNKIRPMPGIALSGFGMEEDIRKSRDAGFQTHLTKPINFKQLHEAIQRSVS